MKRYHNVVQDKRGSAVAGAEIRVREYPSGNTAPIYMANSATSSSRISALLSDGFGQFEFYAKDGRYFIDVYVGGELQKTLTDVLIEDPKDPSEVNTSLSTQRDADIQTGVIRSAVTIEAMGPVWDAINDLNASSIDYGLITESPSALS